MKEKTNEIKNNTNNTISVSIGNEEYEPEPRGDFHDFDEDEINRKRITDNKVKGIAFDYLKNQLEALKETFTDKGGVESLVSDTMLRMLDSAYKRALELCGFN